jgi:hypothetical protein
LQRAELDAKRIKDCLRDLQQLPPTAAVVDALDLGERFMLLDGTMMVARDYVQKIEDVSRSLPPAVSDAMAKGLLNDIDWDLALRNANRWCDRLVAAMRIKERALREKKINEVEKELRTLKKRLADARWLSQFLFVLAPPKNKGNYLGKILVCEFLPALGRTQQFADRAKQIEVNLQLAFALAAYKREHGHYPKKLDALAPKYLAKIPPDLFSGKSLIYRPSEKGYLLYSVGVNGKDDQGRSYDDDPPGDDLKVRMPLPKLPEK